MANHDLLETEEGIFRKSGLLDDIHALKQRIDQQSFVPADLLDEGIICQICLLYHFISPTCFISALALMS